MIPLEPKTAFVFDSSTGTITDYLSSFGTVVEIPTTIDGVAVIKIGANAFNDKGITSITIPVGITEIGDHAFAHNSLITLTIPQTVKKYRIGSFSYNSLKTL